MDLLLFSCVTVLFSQEPFRNPGAMELKPLTLFSIAHISNHDMVAMRTITNLLCYPSPSCIVTLDVEGFHVTVCAHT